MKYILVGLVVVIGLWLLVRGRADNIKVTHPEDRALATAILEAGAKHENRPRLRRPRV